MRLMTDFEVISLSVRIDTTGPLFTGLAQEEVKQFAHHIEEVLGEMGVSMIRTYLPTQYMYLGHHGGTPDTNPIPSNAGELVASIHTVDVEEAVIVTDDPVTYGPWIEGISNLNLVIWPHRKNPPARRFPGYHAFRKITQSLDAMAVPVAVRELQPYLRRMNGDG
jgi:hypothetical protein